MNNQPADVVSAPLISTDSAKIPQLSPGTIVRIPGLDVPYVVDKGLRTAGAEAMLTLTTVDGLDWGPRHEGVTTMDSPRRKWRLPETMGGLVCEEVQPASPSLVNLFGRDAVVLRAEDKTDFVMAVADLVEVRPPSIEDPAPPLPWSSDPDSDGDVFEVRGRPSYALQVRLFNTTAPDKDFRVNVAAKDCRMAARILWQHAAAWEAGDRP